jgi:C4-dicarboxylate-specific signal transduction histidine kinase
MHADEFKSFIMLVGEMRNSQREFFRTRSNTALEVSKRLERRVDERLKELAQSARQLGLFSKEDD